MSKLWTTVLLASMALPLAAQESECPAAPEALRAECERVIVEYGGGTLLDLIENELGQLGGTVMYFSTDRECPDFGEGAFLQATLPPEGFLELSTLEFTLLDMIESELDGIQFMLEMEGMPESE